MNYKETIQYLFSQLPVYQRIGSAAYRADLKTTRALDKILKHPHSNYPSVHIAGTNGKGSVSHMLSAVLQEAGYKTGLYTSPHLVDFRERIKINGEMITKKNVIDFVDKYKSFFEPLKPSFFEITFALAIKYFFEKNIDIAIIETGLGGRLDSTNVISPVVSAITNVSLDHTVFLGDTKEKIAHEKAGIIKSETPVVVGESREETKRIFIEKAKFLNADIVFADYIFHYKQNNLSGTSQSFQISNDKGIVFSDLVTDLMGDFQGRNILTTLAVIEALKKQGFIITDRHIHQGLLNVSGKTGFTGRWQIIGQKPLIICDVVHNREGIEQVVKQLKSIDYEKLHIVFGTVKERNPDNILDLLPDDANYYFTKAAMPRSLNEKDLLAKAEKYGLKGECYSSVQKAFLSAKKKAQKDDLIFIGGSNFIVAEVLAKKYRKKIVN